MKKVLTNVVSGGAGAGAGIASVAVCGTPGLSAVGISTGLATLGVGSMVIGIGVVGLIGAGVFCGIRSLFE